MTRRTVLWVVLAVAFIASAGAVGWLLSRHDGSTPGELAVGDCFDLPAGQQTAVGSVAKVSCDTPHDGEVFWLGTVTGVTAFPSETDLRTYLAAKCVPALQDYSGIDVTSASVTEYDISWFSPTQDGWAGGDRAVTCYVDRLDGTKLGESLRRN